MGKNARKTKRKEKTRTGENFCSNFLKESRLCINPFLKVRIAKFFFKGAGNLHTNFASHEFLSLLSGFSIKTKEERKKDQMTQIGSQK